MEVESSLAINMITNIVKEADDYTVEVINKYVKEQEKLGKVVISNIIGEGELKHILNVGIECVNELKNTDFSPSFLFQQEEYITFLRREIDKLQYENSLLKDKIYLLENDIRGGDKS